MSDFHRETDLRELTLEIERQGGGRAAERLDHFFAPMGRWYGEIIANARNSVHGRAARAEYQAKVAGR